MSRTIQEMIKTDIKKSSVAGFIASDFVAHQTVLEFLTKNIKVKGGMKWIFGLKVHKDNSLNAHTYKILGRKKDE